MVLRGIVASTRIITNRMSAYTHAVASLSTSAPSSPISIPLYYYPSPTSSTQVLARSLLPDHTVSPSLVPTPFAVMSSSQTSGLGTNSRVWLSPPGNLYLTFAIPATLLGVPEGGSIFAGSNPFPITLLPMQVGVLVHRAIASLQSSLPPSFPPFLPLSLKWPNDVLCGGGKVAGVLIQSEVSPQTTTFLIGVGVNVTVAPPVPPSGPEVGRRSAKLLMPLADADVAAFADAAEQLSQPSEGTADGGAAAASAVVVVVLADSSEAVTPPPAAPNDELVRRLGSLLVGEMKDWLQGLSSGVRVEPRAVTEAFARHVDFETELVMRPERMGGAASEPNVRVVPRRIMPDGTLEVKVVETGEIKILASEYTM